MKSAIKGFVALLLVLGMAAPALADVKVNGYYRLQGIMTNTDDSSVTFDGPNTAKLEDQTLIDQRIRGKITDTLNDNVSFVVYTEIDSTWGVAGKDGGPGGDRVAIEVKNAYLDFKSGIFSVRTGLQGIGGRYEGLIVFDDWSAATVAAQLSDQVKLTLLYSKPSEGVNYYKADDTNLYAAYVDVKANDNLNIGGDVYFLQNRQGAITGAGAGDSLLLDGSFTSNPFDLYIVAAKVGAKVGDVGIDGFLIYDNGTEQVTGGADFDGICASVKAKAKINDIGLAGRVLYMSGDDGTGSDWSAFMPNLGGNYDLAGDNLMIMLTDKYYNNGPGGRMALDAAVKGAGLIAFTAQANAKVNDYYGNLALGYFMASESQTGIDDSMGTEVALRVGTKVAEKVDISLNGAYALLGDYWKDSIGSTQDVDDIFKVVGMINVGF